jgi:hypothetical protein
MKATNKETLLIGAITLNEFKQLNSKKIVLPELTGSPKQIAWAEEIRISWMQEFDRFVAEATANLEYLQSKGKDAQERFNGFVKDANSFIVITGAIQAASTWIGQKSPHPFSDVTRNNFRSLVLTYIECGGDFQEDQEWEDFYESIAPAGSEGAA